MINTYKLTYTGLVSAISSSMSRPMRLLLLRVLAGGEQSVEKLAALFDLKSSEIDTMFSFLVEKGCLSSIDDSSYADQSVIKDPREFILRLESLSVNGKVILADSHGLILTSSGYSQSDAEYIASIATNLVHISEQAKARIKKQTDNKLWYTGLSWGDVRGLCMSVFIGSKQYILVVGGLPNLEKIEFFEVVDFLVRRYGYG